QCGYIWDDDFYVTNNKTLHDIEGLGRIWFRPGATPQYYPLTFTSFWIEYRLWHLNPAGYHLTNTLLQALNGVLLWLVLRRLAIPGAWLAAAIFAIHPVHVESVAWITERKNVLCGAFYLASALAYLRYARPGESDLPTTTRRRWYIAALVLFLCALFSKTVACTLPVALLLILWWKRDRISWRDIIPLLPMFAIGLALGLVTVAMERMHVGAVGREWSLSWIERCLVAGRAVWFYLGKLLWPHPLIFIYPRWHIDGSVAWQYLWPAATLGTLLALWFARRRIGREPLIAALFFVVTLGPALGFINVYPMRYSFVADHFQYLASIGPIAGLTALLAMLVRKAVGVTQRTRVQTPLLLKTAKVAAGALLAGLVVLAWRQIGQYDGEETLWIETLERNPGAWMAHNNWGKVLAEKGRVNEAIDCFTTTVKLNPEYAEGYYNRGTVYGATGKSDQAIHDFSVVIELNPRHAKAHNNRGNTYSGMRSFDLAVRDFDKAIELQPDFAEAYYNRGNTYSSMGNFERAIQDFGKAIEVLSDYAEAYRGRGNAYRATRSFERAIRDFNMAIEQKPDYAEAYVDRGNTYSDAGSPENAMRDYGKAIEVRPNFAEAYYSRGTANVAMGNLNRAILDLNSAIELKPGYAEAYNNLGFAQLSLRDFSQAILNCTKAIELKPDQAGAYNNRAIAYYGLKEYGKAWLDVHKCRELGGAVNPEFIKALTQASNRPN
ncbi:MAG TPA: tetratricopeptide repeat protein, partial [Phycisphaerae bacterium]|nr:tetratricopeptide repeat protein [Phycisphaerae bacterium]